MQTMIRITVVSLLVLLAHRAEAQVSIRNSNLGKAVITSADAPAGPQVAKIGMNVLDVEATFPLLNKQEAGDVTLLENTFGFRQQNFTYVWPAGDTEYRPDRVYGASYSINLIKTHGENWRSITFLSGGAYSDFEDFGTDDLLIEGGSLLVRSVGEHWQIGVGPVFTYAFGNPLVIPAPYLRYQGEGKVSVDVRVPQYAVVGLQMGQNVQMGVALRSLYNNYKLGDPSAQDASGEHTSIVFSDLTLGLESKVRLGSGASLDFGVSTTLDRTFEINDHRGDKLFSRGLDRTWVASVGLSLFGQK